MRRFWLASAVSLALMTGGSADSVFSDDTNPDFDQVYISSIDYFGAGCPPGSLWVDLVPLEDENPRTFGVAVRLDRFHVPFEPGVPPYRAGKSCLLTLRLGNVPPWYTPDLHAIDHRGEAHIESGVLVRYKTTFLYGGGLPWRERTTTFAGPHDGPWLFQRSRFPVAFVPCNKTELDFDIDVRLDGGSAPPSTGSSFTVGSSQEDVTQVYKMYWARCGAI